MEVLKEDFSFSYNVNEQRLRNTLLQLLNLTSVTSLSLKNISTDLKPAYVV